MNELFNFVLIIHTLFNSLQSSVTAALQPQSDIGKPVGHTDLSNLFGGNLQGAEATTDTDSFAAYLTALITQIGIPHTLSITITSIGAHTMPVLLDERITLTLQPDNTIAWSTDASSGSAASFEEIIQYNYQDSGIGIADYINTSCYNFDAATPGEYYRIQSSLTTP